MEESIINVLEKNNFKFKHKLGQNFLTDKNLLNAIVSDAKINKNDNVLEIGAGAGTLTKEIANKTDGKIVSVEIDKTLKPILKENLKDVKNLTLIFGDILKFSPNDVSNWFDGKKFKVVANLPYYISSPIIFYLIENNFKIESLTIMLQLELAQRLSAKPGSKEYGAISVLLDLISNVSIKRKVPKTLFTPQPKVDSAIVNIEIDFNKNNIDYFKISNFIKICFSMKRKTLINNLSQGLKIEKDIIKQVFELNNINLNCRAEDLTTNEFIKIFSLFEKMNL